MTLPPDDRPRLKDAFAGARALAKDERPAYLAEACDGNEALRQEVESLLSADERMKKSFLEAPAVVRGDDTRVTRGLEGQRIGPYQLASRIGAGGMGEVYQARDTTLNRLVAIKLLLPAIANDPDRLTRFRREAQVLASLNHPHIAQIHGFEDADDVHALVMELVEGPTLADRIVSGAIPIDEALAIASQIADALEAAHEQGIIHRDLKPANIKVREDGTVKVLDFGLAKGLDVPSSAGVEVMQSPTLGAHATEAGVILGTAAYMSPEQARGKAVDRRADLWAFGCVLYEMLTRQRAFGGDTPTDVLAAVVTTEPDWTRLPAETPAAIRRLLRRCLEKDRKARLDSAAGARLEIDDAIASPGAEALAVVATPSRRITPVTIAALAGLTAIVALVAWIWMQPVSVAPMVPSRFAIVPPSDRPLNSSAGDRDIALLPDGRHFVYLAGGGLAAGATLMLRATDQLDARPLPGFGLGVFSSPDSGWIGFFSNSALNKVSITGGAAVSLVPLHGASRGASWGDDNTIVFATDDPTTGLWRVSADGGEPTVLTTPDAALHESDHVFPSVLPAGRGVLFTILGAGQAGAQVAVLDSRSGRRKTLVRDASQPEYVDPAAGTGRTGYLIYATAGTLRAVRFDLARLEVLGDPVTVVERVMTKPTGAANYAASRQGMLVFVPGGVGVLTPKSLVWVNRSGREEPINAPLRSYGPPRISPDGTQVAFNIIEQEGADIWIWDFARETMRRVTFAPGIDGTPHWTADGQRLVFTSNRTGVYNLYSQAVDGTGPVDRLTTSANMQYSTSISPDGTVVGFETVPIAMAPGVATRIRLFPPARPASRPSSVPAGTGLVQADPSDQTLIDGSWPEVSANGRYLAYQSRESGRSEVYVRPFPHVHSGRWQVSAAGGTRPAWARSGRELFYLDASNTLTAVSVQTSGSAFSAGKPAKVFDAKYATPMPPRHYDVSADGQRFLMLKDSEAADPSATPASMVVVLNWHEELKQRLPIR